MVIGLKRGVDLHLAQLMPLPLTVSCFSKIQIGFYPSGLAHLGSPRQRTVKRVCVFYQYYNILTHTHTRLAAIFPGLNTGIVINVVSTPQ